MVDQTQIYLAGGSIENLGPEELFSVSPNTPRGNYSVVCRLTNAITGASIAVDKATFTIE